MAQIARTAANKASSAARNVTDKVTEITRETAGQAANVARDSLHVVRQAVDAAAEVERTTVRHTSAGMAEISRSLMNLFSEQSRANVELVQALSQPAKWSQAAQLQSEYLRTSFLRTAQFTRRYVEVSQAVVASALSTARGQAKKAA